MAKKFVVSDESVLNDYGFRVLTSGIRQAQFEKNPIGLFMHKRSNRWEVEKESILPICIWANLTVEGGQLLAEPIFDQNDEFAKVIESKVEGGFIRMASIGINPITWSSDDQYLLPGQTRETVVECELVEISIVDFGSNPNAIALYDKEQNLITLNSETEKVIIPLIKSKEKPEETQIDLNMKNIAILLGMSENATEGEILEAVKKNQETVLALTSQVATIELSAIESAVQLGIDDKRYTADKKAELIELGKKVGVESLKKTIELMRSVGKPTDHITGTGKEDDKTITLASLMKEGISAVEKLKAEDPEKYAELYAAHYGHKFTPKLED
ncbi:MAG: hypothetical protein Q7U54_07890 [Bacteroidales bacterium]|nr:hypothetical protein [Bacteroidales bacterium]